jgi:CheY-like chemotaxis protein
MRKDLTLMKRIALLGVFSIIGLILLILINISNLSSMNENFQKIIEEDATKSALSKEIKSNFIELHRAEKNTILAKSNQDMLEYKNEFDQVKIIIEKNISELKINIDKENAPKLDALEKIYVRYVNNYEIIYQLTLKKLNKEAIELSQVDSKTHINEARILISEISEYNELELADAIKKSNDRYKKVRNQSIIIFLCFISLLIYFNIIIYKYFNKRLATIYTKVEFIKNGEFEEEYVSKNDYLTDELGLIARSLSDAIGLLKKGATENKSQNWVKDGVSLLNKNIIGKEILLDQASTSINELCRYIKAGMGALYLYDEKDESLKLEGAYALKKGSDITSIFKLGEGIVGQVAYDRKPILLTNILDGPIIHSATTKAKALNTYTHPLVFKNHLIGVIEVASNETFTPIIIEYINSVVIAIAGSLYVSIQANATSALLTQSQELFEELERQNVELESQTLAMNNQHQELASKNTELENSHLELEKRATDLEDANRYKSEFLASMSHELRTPLNSILLLSGSLSNVMDIETEKLNKQAATIYGAGTSLLKLINDILDLSRIEAKLMTVSLEEIEISNLLHDLEELFTPQYAVKNIHFNSTVSTNSSRILISDKAKIMQVLINFLSNAIKFSGDNGQISIEVAVNPEEDKEIRPITISVIDSGIGIAQEKMTSIFEAFTQADGGTSRKYGGTGLGLTISKELTEILGGRIGVTSSLGKGSCFCLYLPLQIDTDFIDEKLVDVVQYKNTLRGPLPTKKQSLVVDDRANLVKNDVVILVVEDDEALANIIFEAIHKLKYKALVAFDGSAAIFLAKEYVPNAIILDIILPMLNGIEVLRFLKSDIKTRHIPINILSSTGSGNIVKKLGALNFIKKPVLEDEINQIINSLVEFVKQKQKYILVVEDDEVQSEYLTELLTDDGISVTTVDTAKAGLKEALKNNYDCAVIDLNLPDMSGFKLLELIDDNNINLPIIIYTARNLTSSELVKLRKYSDTVVLKTATSSARLVEEVSLFLHRSKNSLNEEKQILLSQAMSINTDLEGKKVLLVDDDVRNLYALSSVLEVKGLEITSAQNGSEALELLKDIDKNFDIILMDIMMPVMDGYETIRQIRKDKKIKNIPIIALTAKAQKEDKQLCIDAGADDYMSKPIDHELLLSLLNVWLMDKLPYEG